MDPTDPTIAAHGSGASAGVAQRPQAAAQDASDLLHAAAHDKRCARLALEVASRGAAHRLDVALELLDICARRASANVTSRHPVHGPALAAVRAGDAAGARELLAGALTYRRLGSCARLLVQLAYVSCHLVEDVAFRGATGEPERG